MSSPESTPEARIRIKCSRPGCPRERWTVRMAYDPPEAVVMLTECPWHEQSGCKGEQVTYRDAKGQEVFCDRPDPRGAGDD